MAYYTLTDLVKINDRSTIDAGLTDILNEAPFLAALPAITATHGTLHQYVKEITAPTVGFRQANVGRELSSSSDELVVATLEILDASFAVDIAMADSFVKGGATAFIAREAARHLRAAFFAFERQILNGSDVNGFSGLADELDALTHPMVVNASGTTASTGSSVYLIRATGDEKDVMAVVGQGGQINVGESVTQVDTDEYDLKLPIYFTPILGYAGVQIGGARSVARICNLTEQTNNKLTDARIYSAVSLFPAGRGPTHAVMSRRSLRQLRESRTATNATGAPAPFPVDIDGIKIIVTDALSDTETIISA